MNTAHSSLINWLRDNPHTSLDLVFNSLGACFGLVMGREGNRIGAAFGKSYEAMCHDLMKQISPQPGNNPY